MANDSTSVSLLEDLARAKETDETWRDFFELYGPLVEKWLRARSLSAVDAEDVRQEVMSVVLQEIGTFEHNGRTGAFRNWLRRVTSNRLKTFWRRNNRDPQAQGGSDCVRLAEQLADPNSELSGLWDKEHNAYVLQYLLMVIRKDVKASTVKAFERVALEGATVDEVAKELGISENAVRIAQSRVLQRLRQLGRGLID